MDAAEAMQRHLDGELPLRAIPMKLGDVMIRDVRALHRGTPNNTDVPRPMVVIGYSRKWYFRPEVNVQIPPDVLATLSPKAKRLLRYMPVLHAEVQDADAESYTRFAY